MARTNESGNCSRPHDEESDHIGSGASTPPGGTATPRPDLTSDKRLPGLNSINNYFAQVCDSLRVPSKLSTSTAPSNTLSESAAEVEKDGSQEHCTEDRTALPTAPSSPLSMSGEPYESPPLLPHEKAVNTRACRPTQAFYPTPPLSNSSSMFMLSSDETGVDGARAAEFSRVRFSLERMSIASPSKLRRHTLSTNALSSIVTKPAVSAEISNPSTNPSHTAPSSPAVAHRSSSRLDSDKENRALTSGARRHQNTPPQTPRSGSHESRRGEAAGHEAQHAQKAAKSSRSSSGGSNSATIGQLKGQFSVSIEEARGLRPSVSPYVVCIFQLNEDISDGPKVDEMDTAMEDGPAGDEDLARGVAMRRMGSGSGTPMAIPGMRSRQSSQTNIAGLRRGLTRPENQEVTDPVWRHTSLLYVKRDAGQKRHSANRVYSDVVGEQSELDISVYDKSHNEAFLGHIRLQPHLEDYEHSHEGWYKLEPREGESDTVTGEIHLKMSFHNTGKKTYGPDDFEILKLIGKGTFGQVFQVRKKDTRRIYAMKVLSKKVIVQKKEIQHTIGERNILVRTATTESPFIVGLKFSFQTPADLYLVTDYMSGGELFWHLQKEGRFEENRAKFYIAELILALRHLHQHDIVYRDLKPENILLDANGHIALCDFGLSKANLAKNDTTNTFCGTTEYLAPEVLLDEQGYTKMVDFWSLGVLVFEMCCGWSPFYAEDTQQMYKNIAFGKVRFPRDALSTEGRNFVKGLLNRNPGHRLGAKKDADELMEHAFFNDIDWKKLGRKEGKPPFKPKLKGELDTSNFDPEFTNALGSGTASSLNARAAALASGINNDSTPLSPTMQNQFKGFTFVDESTLEQQYAGKDIGQVDGSADSPTQKNFSNQRGDRMSGVVPTNEPEGMFNDGMLDDI